MQQKQLPRLQIIIISFVIALLLVSWAIFNFHRSFMQLEMQNTQEVLKNEAKSSAQQIKDKFTNMISLLEHLANNTSENFLENPYTEQTLASIAPLTPFDFIGVADTSGISLDSNGQSTNVTQRKYYQESMQGKISISEIMESKITKDKIVQILSVPIKQHGEITGICFGVFNLESLSNEIDSYDTESAYLQIVDSEGNYVTQKEQVDALKQHDNVWEDLKEYTFKEGSLSSLQNDIKNKKSGFFRFSLGKEERVSYYQPLGIDNWYIFSSTDKDNIDSHVSYTTSLVFRLVILISVSFFLIFLIILYISKKSKDMILQAHRETKNNEELLTIALEESNNSIFEYKQKEKRIIVHGNVTNLFHLSELNNVPQCFKELGFVSETSMEDCYGLFEDIQKQDSTSRDLKLINDGKETWYRITMKNIYDHRHTIINTVGIIENIDEQMLQKLELAENERIQAKLISNALTTCMIDLNQGIIKEKDDTKVEEKLLYQDYLRDHIVPFIIDNDRASALACMSTSYLLKEHLSGKDTTQCIFRMLIEQKTIWVSCTYHIIEHDDDKDIYALMIINDINDWKSKEIELQKQAERDGLTDLYNATTLKSKMNEYLQSIQSLDGYQIFILMDLDNFKTINDTFGHAYGDRVLKDVARILSSKFRRNDIVARLGGDEFVVVLMNVKDKDGIHRIYEELVNDLNITYTENDISITVSVSLGISIAPEHGNDFQTLYQKADKALYKTKKQNKNGYSIYNG